MIFTETREGRRFVGEVPPGAPLMHTLRQLADGYRMDSGWLEGAGVVRDAVVRGLTGSGEWSVVRTLPGVSQVALTILM